MLRNSAEGTFCRLHMEAMPPEPSYRVVSSHSGGNVEGTLTNEKRGEQIQGVEVVDSRENPPAAARVHSVAQSWSSPRRDGMGMETSHRMKAVAEPSSDPTVGGCCSSTEESDELQRRSPPSSLRLPADGQSINVAPEQAATTAQPIHSPRPVAPFGFAFDSAAIARAATARPAPPFSFPSPSFQSPAPASPSKAPTAPASVTTPLDDGKFKATMSKHQWSELLSASRSAGGTAFEYTVD